MTESQDKSRPYGLGLTQPGAVSRSITRTEFLHMTVDNSLHFSLHLSFPPKGIKSYSLNRRMRVSSRGSVGLTSSASWNDASPVPAGYDPEDLLRNCAPCRSPARGGRAFCASLCIRGFGASSSLHLSSGSSHSWLHLRTALNHTKL